MASPYAGAISGIESGGNYSLLGPVTKSGDRAYGRYQVMGSNIGPWTKQYYGQELTPQQFLANPQAQDAVFNGQFGQYVEKYGPEGAARAWFAGPGGMNNPNAKDMLGTTVADYARKFNAAAPMSPGSPAPPLAPPVDIQASAQPAQQPSSGIYAPPQQDNSRGLLALASMGQQMLGGNPQPIAPPQVGAPYRPQVNLQPLMAFIQSRQLPAGWAG